MNEEIYNFFTCSISVSERHWLLGSTKSALKPVINESI